MTNTDRTLTQQQSDVYDSMYPMEWVRPMDVGGRDGSHHSSTLAALVKKGLVERRTRGSNRSYVYRRIQL